MWYQVQNFGCLQSKTHSWSTLLSVVWVFQKERVTTVLYFLRWSGGCSSRRTAWKLLKVVWQMACMDSSVNQASTWRFEKTRPQAVETTSFKRFHFKWDLVGKIRKKTSLEFVDVNDFMIGIILMHRIPMWLLAPLGVCNVPSTSFFRAQLIGQKSYNLSRNEHFIRFLVRLPLLTLSVSQTYEKSRCFKRKVFLQLSLCFQCLQQAKKWCGFSNPTELNTESLDFNENFSDIDDLTFDQRLQENAHQAYQAILHILVLNVFTRGNAVGDVKMNKLMGQVDRCS